MTITIEILRSGTVGFIDWLDVWFGWLDTPQKQPLTNSDNIRDDQRPQPIADADSSGRGNGIGNSDPGKNIDSTFRGNNTPRQSWELNR